jgi:hypothetical protein
VWCHAQKKHVKFINCENPLFREGKKDREDPNHPHYKIGRKKAVANIFLLILH